jgi:hypothetical protein
MLSIAAMEENTVRVRAYCSQKNRQSVTMPDEVRDGEIVGLESSTNGRSCGSLNTKVLWEASLCRRFRQISSGDSLR